MNTSWIFLVLLLLVTSAGTINKSKDQNKTYAWIAKDFNPCSLKPGFCGEGVQEREVWCKVSSERTARVEDDKCLSYLKPASTVPCFQDCEKLKPLLWWNVTDWSVCETENNTSVGVARRTATCLLVTNETKTDVVEDAACQQFEEKPSTRMDCSGDKVRDCVIADALITLSRCKLNCTQMKASRVLVAPSDGGIQCKNTLAVDCHAQSCLNRSQGKDEYISVVGAWSPCIASQEIQRKKVARRPFVQSPLVGRKRRNITCVNKTEVINVRYCWQNDIPNSEESCVVPVDCYVSPWSQWSLSEECCINSKGKVTPEIQERSRKIVRLPQGHGKPCPILKETRKIVQHLKYCQNYTYRWLLSEWGKCIIIDPENSLTCGGGVQHRQVICVHFKDDVPVPDSFCKESYPEIIHECYIPCKVSCSVSEWSAWSICTPEFESSLDLIDSECKERFRTVSQEYQNVKRDCPHLHEIYELRTKWQTWKYSEWSDCTAFDNITNCGKGKRIRNSFCSFHDGTIISNDYCEIFIGPQEDLEGECHVPCSNDCVMSEWSPSTMCSHPCHRIKGEKTKRNRRVLAFPTERGRKCGRLEETDGCGYADFGCVGAGWEVRSWEKCVPFFGKVCGDGNQTRDVLCKKGNKLLKSLSCQHIPTPQTIRNCTLPCPVDCAVSKFSEWTPCPKICDTAANQTRKRYVLQEAKYGGRECSNVILTEVRKCREANDAVCQEENLTFQWKVDNWSSCMILDNAVCGKGVQVRDATCLQNGGKPTATWNCIKMEGYHHLPLQFRECYIDCSNNCTFWDVKSLKFCGYECTTQDAIPSQSWIADFCQRFLHTTTDKEIFSSVQNFSTCIATNSPTIDVNGVPTQGYCGSGEISKLDTGQSTDFRNLAVTDVCTVVDCPQDCKMFKWSEWSPCNTRCGPGYRSRSRKVSVMASDSGRPCPATEKEEQDDVCSVQCDQYQWETNLWSNCKLTNSTKKCGIGKQYRNISCVEVKNDDRVKVVANEICEPALKPSRVRDCKIFCLGECVVSDWSEWDECPKPCSSQNLTTRGRTILRSFFSDYSCPELKESVECTQNVNCYDASWVKGGWGSCIVPEGASCGPGLQRRALMCQRSDKISLDPSVCQRNSSLHEIFEEMRNCSIICPVDCVVSSWSDWDTSSCKNANGSGFYKRRRWIKQMPSQNGRPCPILEQKKTCVRSLYYTWEIGEWTLCNLQGGTCGFGTRHREVKCVNAERMEVNVGHCLTYNTSDVYAGWIDPRWLEVISGVQREETCQIPCPFDCLLSDWTEWSHCERNCKEGEIAGYQTRSRVVFGSNNSECLQSQELYQTRPCLGGPCLTFEWKIINDHVACVTSVGVIVYGGCERQPRPCVRACPVNRSFCDGGTGNCQCKPGFIPVYSGKSSSQTASSHVLTKDVGWLVRCDVSPEMDSGKNGTYTLEYPNLYFPTDSETSFWFYAMISVGTAFIIFVIVTIYLMCHSTFRERIADVRREAVLRRRTQSTDDSTSYSKVGERNL